MKTTTKKTRRPAAKALAAAPAEVVKSDPVVETKKAAPKKTAAKKAAAKAKVDTANPFKAGTKRHWFYDALVRPAGCTAAQGSEFSGWSAPVAQSEFYEVSRKTGRPLKIEVTDAGRVYRL